jgi:hypothetical protein
VRGRRAGGDGRLRRFRGSAPKMVGGGADRGVDTPAACRRPGHRLTWGRRAPAESAATLVIYLASGAAGVLNAKRSPRTAGEPAGDRRPQRIALRRSSGYCAGPAALARPPGPAGAGHARAAPGRPRAVPAMRALLLEVARDNPGPGDRRIHGELTGRGDQPAPPPVSSALTTWFFSASRAAGPTSPRRVIVAWPPNTGEKPMACSALPGEEQPRPPGRPDLLAGNLRRGRSS